eukprot:gnl/Spiro4/12497_TR6605_c0_g1_i1.p1 gnl/Spiro4/12497_TR6605_c0_g1~~gnl/Spiro4/12497_TR6605_c0_g1_i1.p1  ORF type:complete len:570 (+),score=61.23 gnl/Spiro4/12497_TR6605_c0_g1_i1:78-1712(+)
MSSRYTPSTVTVHLRVREPFAAEQASGGMAVTVDGNKATVAGYPPLSFDRVYPFDRQAPGYADQQEICKPLGEQCGQGAFRGDVVGLIAYGCGNSGRRYTMYGDSVHKGVFTFAVDEIFKEAAKFSHQTEVKFSVQEFYEDQKRDLLGPQSATPAPNAEPTLITLASANDIYPHITAADENRKQGFGARGFMISVVEVVQQTPNTPAPTKGRIVVVFPEEPQLQGNAQSQRLVLPRTTHLVGDNLHSCKKGSRVKFRDSMVTVFLNELGLYTRKARIHVFGCISPAAVAKEPTSVTMLFMATVTGQTLEPPPPRKQTQSYPSPLNPSTMRLSRTGATSGKDGGGSKSRASSHMSSPMPFAMCRTININPHTATPADILYKHKMEELQDCAPQRGSPGPGQYDPARPSQLGQSWRNYSSSKLAQSKRQSMALDTVSPGVGAYRPTTPRATTMRKGATIGARPKFAIELNSAAPAPWTYKTEDSTRRFRSPAAHIGAATPRLVLSNEQCPPCTGYSPKLNLVLPSAPRTSFGQARRKMATLVNFGV